MNILKTATEATGLSLTQIEDIRRAMPTSPVKILVEYDLDVAIHNTSIEIPKTTDDYHFQRGIREGLIRAKGILSKTK